VSFRERLAKLDHFQKSKIFKIVSTGIIVALALVVIGYGLLNNSNEQPELIEQMSKMPTTVTNYAGEEIENPALARAQQIQSLYDQAKPGTLYMVGAIAISTMLIIVIWMGLGLVHPVLALLAIGVYWPLRGTPYEALGSILLGMMILALCFMALIRASGLLLGFSYPVTAIAKNVLAEAIRMKISLVFIVMLFFVLAALPMMLESDTSLRYRIQNFLQYSSSFTFMFIALLVVFFGAATVTYEQREKVIWQTMTKPVAAWQYMLGKWLGVVALAAILLTVSATGVFLFTEYLRNQPAIGETLPFQAKDGQDITEDRLFLETQVLASRESVLPLSKYDINDPLFDAALDEQIERERASNPSYNPNSAERRAIKHKVYSDLTTEYFSIDPLREKLEEYVFVGLGRARAEKLPLTLRYKINAEGNRPDKFYILTFGFDNGQILPPRRTGLGFSHTLTIPPEFINDRGEIRMQIINGQMVADEAGGDVFQIQTNINTINIPPDGLEISYSTGSYRPNFVRVFFVLWIKLAMLAMLAVWASSFTSFPVACLISGGLFLIGESSGFVQESLPGWGKTNAEGDPSLYHTVIYHIADNVSSFFKVYTDLSPTTRLTEGRMLSWASVSQGVFVLGLIATLFYFSGVLIFRRRQLAIYSGQ